MADKTLDARDLKCPFPILKTNRAMADVPVGGTLEVLATDPGAVSDFHDFAAAKGHDLVSHTTDGDVHRFVLRRGR